MLTSYKNSSLIKFFVGLSVVIAGSVIPTNSAGATDESTPEPITSVEVVQPEVLSEPEVVKPVEEFAATTNHDVFFSQDRDNPYSSKELEHEPTEAEIRGDSWESRVAKCDTLADYNAFADCMFRPWIYGF